MTRHGVIIAMVCASLLQACGPQKHAVRSAPDRCAVATKVIGILLLEGGRRKVVFSDRNEEPLFDAIGSSDDWYRPDLSRAAKAPRPPAALVAKLNGAKPDSAVKVCAVVRAALDRSGIEHGEAAVDKAVDPKRMSGGSYAEAIVGFSTPVVSDDGFDALVISSGVSAPLGGGGFVRYLHRDARGRWTLVGMHGLWVA